MDSSVGNSDLWTLVGVFGLLKDSDGSLLRGLHSVSDNVVISTSDSDSFGSKGRI